MKEEDCGLRSISGGEGGEGDHGQPEDVHARRRLGHVRRTAAGLNMECQYSRPDSHRLRHARRSLEKVTNRLLLACLCILFLWMHFNHVPEGN